MRRFFSSTILAATLVVAGCHANSANQLKVGITPGPAEDILTAAKAPLAQQGVSLKLVPFTDYVQPDMALASGDIDVNLYQNVAFLTQFNRDHGTDFVPLAKVYLPPMAIYAGKTKSIAAIQNGARVAIPNDPVNQSRALYLLQHAGLITLPANAGALVSKSQVATNPHQLDIVEVDAAQLPRSLSDVDLAVINANFALDAGLNPRTGSLISEDQTSPFFNVLAVNRAHLQDAAVQKLSAELSSPTVQQFIAEHYHGAIYPASK